MQLNGFTVGNCKTPVYIDQPVTGREDTTLRASVALDGNNFASVEVVLTPEEGAALTAMVRMFLTKRLHEPMG